MNPEDPEFWDDWDVSAPDWPNLTGKERCVIAHAAEEAYLGEIAQYFAGHYVETPAGGAWIAAVADEKIPSLIPEFSRIICQLAAGRIVEVREMPSADSLFYAR